MNKLSFSYQSILPFIKQEEIDNYDHLVQETHDKIHQKTGAGKDFLGWLEVMEENAPELEKIQSAANSIKNDSDVLLVIGIGGSYLGAKAALNLLQHTFTNMFSDKEKDTPHIIFAGQHMSSTYIQELLSIIKDKDVSINVISKSGTTTEPAIAFASSVNLWKKSMEKKKQENASM